MRAIPCQGANNVQPRCAAPAEIVASWQSPPMRAPAFWYLCADHADIAAGLPGLSVRKLAEVLGSLAGRPA